MLTIEIQVVYAGLNSYQCISLKVRPPCTIEQAIEQSGILALYPEINLQEIHQVGIYNEIKSRQDLVEEGDRVEIYRPLHQSAMAARRERVKLQKAQKHKGFKQPLGFQPLIDPE